MPVATTAAQLNEPLVFVSMVTRRPDVWQEARQQALGVSALTALQVDVAAVFPLSGTLATLERLGLGQYRPAGAPHLTMTFDASRQGRVLALTTAPLTLRW